MLKFSIIKDRAWLAGKFERSRLDAAGLGLTGQNIEEVQFSITRLQEEYSKKQKELEEAQRQVALSVNDIERLTKTDIPDVQEKIEKATGQIQNVIRKVGLQTLQEYQQKLQLKSDHEISRGTQIQLLQTHFDSKGEELEENLPYWLGEIEALREFENEARDTTYDRNTVTRLEREKEELEGKESDFEDKNNKLRDQLRDIERKANAGIVQLEGEYLHCATSVDLQAIRDKVLEFVVEVERQKERALTAIRIFEELEREEEEKVASLFGEDSPISKHFSEITGGAYDRVEFVFDEERKVQVRRKDGSMLDVAKLSGGAYDQLYLSIRLALGEKLLGGKGFFIMDDPFIKADKERLQRQLDILKRISESGWQIIYFTAKDEVRDALQQDIKGGKVDLIPLRGMLS